MRALKKNKHIFLFLCLVFASWEGVTQDLFIIKGHLVDKSDKMPVPFATIHVINQNIATIANEEGYFEFHIPSKFLADSIMFSSLGFKTFRAIAKDLIDVKEFQLEPSVIVLSEIIVAVNDDVAVKEIIRKAIENIKINYPDTFLLNAYFRKYQKIDEKYVSYLDAAVELYDDQFTKDLKNKKQPEMINVKAVRKSFTFNKKGYDNWVDQISESSNWLARLLTRNDVRYRNGLLNKTNKFKLIGYTTYNNKLCYEVSVPKKPWHYIRPDNTNYDGKITMVIDATNFMIYHIDDEEKSKSTGKNKNFIWEKKINDTISSRVIGGKKVLEFKEFKGKLYLNYLAEHFYVEDYNVKTKESTHVNEYFWELFVNEINDQKKINIKNFSPGKRDDLKMNLTEYNSAFWNNYNYIPFTSENMKAFKDLSNDISIEEQFKKGSIQLNNQQK